MNKKNPGKFKAGDTVTYCICETENEKEKATERAFHPTEIKSQNLNLDFDYYFKNQLIPVISRLLDPIACTDEQMIAERLGLDPTQFKSKTNERLKSEREAEQESFKYFYKIRKMWNHNSRIDISKFEATEVQKI